MTFKSLAELRKGGSIESLVSEVEKMSKSGFEADERYWKLPVDKAGNGYAVIRFLPPKQGEELPFVRLWTHGFKGPTGQWYIENSLTTIGGNDAIGELNSELWNSGDESKKAIARNQKRKLVYISNILVIRDTVTPENEGKVFLFKYGQKIFEKVKILMQPEFEDEAPVNPFDFWVGANFKLKAKKVAGFPNYDDSKFDAVSPIAKDDDLIEAIWNQQHSLAAEVAPDKFKTPEELKKRLDKVLGGKAPALSSEATEAAPMERAKTQESSTVNTTASKRHPLEEDDDDAESYFQSLAD